MTDEQRDDLLISMAKGLTNLQGSVDDLRKEVKAVDLKLDKRTEELRDEIKAVDLKLDKRTEELRDEIKAVDLKLDKRTEELSGKIKDTEENLRNEIKQETLKNAECISEAFHETWRIATREHKTISKRVDKHDNEIQNLKTKLA